MTITNALRPILAVLAISFILVGCGNTTTTPDTAPITTTPPATTQPATTPTTTTPAATKPTGTVTPPVTTPVSQNTYKDGTYSATGNYFSPEGAESVTVSVTIKDDIITATTFVGNAHDSTSKRMQANFASGYKTSVIGRDIDQVSLSVVNGASLTPKGFMDALKKIKSSAQA